MNISLIIASRPIEQGSIFKNIGHVTAATLGQPAMPLAPFWLLSGYEPRIAPTGSVTVGAGDPTCDGEYFSCTHWLAWRMYTFQVMFWVSNHQGWWGLLSIFSLCMQFFTSYDAGLSVTSSRSHSLNIAVSKTVGTWLQMLDMWCYLETVGIHRCLIHEENGMGGESLGSGEYTTLDPLGWGGGLSCWAGICTVNSCETITIEDSRIDA
jgi:hypothetical protein